MQTTALNVICSPPTVPLQGLQQKAYVCELIFTFIICSMCIHLCYNQIALVYLIPSLFTLTPPEMDRPTVGRPAVDNNDNNNNRLTITMACRPIGAPCNGAMCATVMCLQPVDLCRITNCIT